MVELLVAIMAGSLIGCLGARTRGSLDALREKTVELKDKIDEAESNLK